MSRFSFSSLRFRLLLLVLLTVIPVLGLVLYLASEDRQREVSHIETDALRLARIVSVEEEQLIRGTRQLLVVLAELPQVRDGDPTLCSAFFADLLKQYHRYDNFGAIELDGDVFCSALPTGGPVNAADRGYFQRALQTRDFAIGDYQIGRITGKPSINFGYPVLDEAGQVQAVVFAALDLDWLNQCEYELTAQLPQGSTLTKIDRDGVVLVHEPDPEKWVGQPALEMPLAQTVLAQGPGVVEAVGLDGTPGVYAFAPLPSALYARDMYVIIGIPEDIAFAEVNRVLARNLAGLGLVTVLALAAAWAFGDVFILRQVNALLQATKRLSGGDLSARTALPPGQGELGQLARAFDQMAEALEQREAERKRAEEAVMKHRRELLRLSAQLINAQEAERKRISQELHDEMGQALTAMSINLVVLEKELPSELAPMTRERLAETSSLAERTLEQIRELALDLRPAMLDDLGLVPTVRWYVNRYAKRLNIAVEFEAIDLEERLTAEVETVLYRVVQEGLTNVVRHAQANRVRIRLKREESTVTAFIEDDGRGFDVEEVADHAALERGAGLLGMRERVALLGGSLRIHSRPGQGTRLSIEIPCREGS
jgi:signal transduction histidine kinase